MRKEIYKCMILSAPIMSTSFDVQNLAGPCAREISHHSGELDSGQFASENVSFVYVPYGQPIPQVMGAGNLIVVFYSPEEEEDAKDEE